MFLDAAYVAKYYLNEADSPAVRALIHRAESLTTSAWSIVEVTSAMRRHVREGRLTPKLFHRASEMFREDTENGVWTMIPVSEDLFWRMVLRMATFPQELLLRAGDAVQLASAVESGEHEIWTSDRHVLTAAPHFGLIGRTA
jgi:predicted nucleic acid-binding protein